MDGERRVTMKIYSRHNFLRLPEGTFFAKGVKWAIDGFCIKGETWFDNSGNAIDFLYHNLIGVDSNDSQDFADKLEEMLQKGTSYPMEKDYGRDGCFDDQEMFLVFEREDLKRIREMIQESINDGL